MIAVSIHARDYGNAFEMWNRIEDHCRRSRLFDIHNSFSALVRIRAADFVNLIEYHQTFRNTLGWFKFIFPALKLDTHFLAFLYLEGIKNEFPNFVERHRYSHNVFHADVEGSSENINFKDFDETVANFPAATNHFHIQSEDRTSALFIPHP